jgi:hypothetical protein
MNATNGRDCVKTRITVSFLFVLFSVMRVDRLLRSEKSDPRASHEITPTKSQGKLEF